MLEPLAEELSALHPPALNPDKDYSVPWILRSKLLPVLYDAGVKRLKVTSTTKMQDLYRTFPDANSWMSSMMSVVSMVDFLAMPLIDYMQHLHYKHPPELLSMFFCLFGDADVLTFSLTWLRKHKKQLRAFRVKYESDHGVQAHPFILLNAFKRILEGGRAKVLKRPAARSLAPIL